ncbi:MAG: DUF935 family protein [Flavobacteriales bacterium]|jgi:SPP1 gp7 family putative phage head morphogenesis protein|nr:DUF935 family protein [Flavobacteriales bacterium]
MSTFQNIKNSIKGNVLKLLSDRDIIVEAAVRKSNSIEGRVQPHEKSLVAVDIQHWRAAILSALNNEDPDRIQLYQVYENILIDNHLSSIIESRILRVLGSPFKVINSDGEENTDLTKLLERSWFEQFIKHTLSSRFWGSTLIELVQGENGIEKAVLIPRENCNFKKKVIYLKPDDDKGISFDKVPLLNTIVEIGNFYNLGLLYKAAPIALAKKYALGSWSEYTEKFGVPFRWVTTDITNDTRATKLGEIMSAMGSAGWGVFKKGEEINVMDTPGTSAHQIFDALIERTNKEMSKLILGQTMTTDSGSSRSQAEVHKQVAEDRHLSDKIFIKNIINDSLLPRLNNLGVGNFEGYSFDWDTTEELSLIDLIDTVTKLSGSYEIDTEYITEKTGIPIIGIKSSSNNTQELSEDEKTSSKKKDKTVAFNFSIPVMQEDSCCGDTSEPLMESPTLKKIQEKLLKDVHSGVVKLSSQSYFDYLKEEYIKSLNEGFKAIKSLDYNKPDHTAKAFMEANISRFSAAKNLAMVNELNAVLNDSNSFNEFRTKAQPLLKQFNATHLKTEYEFARAVAQNASRYYRQQDNIEENPYYIYKTAADNRVRQSHEVLHNKVFSKKDSAVQAIYPPNGWGCRCEMVETFEVPKGQKLLSGSDAKELLQSSGIDNNGVSEWDRMKQGRFNVNRGDLKTVFDENKLYVKGNFEQTFNLKNNGLKQHANINKNQFKELKTKSTSRIEALEWFDKRVGDNDLNDSNNIRLTDFSDKPITINKKQFKQHLKDDRADYVSVIDELLNAPDEVYLVNQGNGKFGYRYVKFYKNKVMNAFVRLDKDKNLLDLRTWHPLDKAIDTKREGILVRKSNYK